MYILKSKKCINVFLKTDLVNLKIDNLEMQI